MKTIGLLFILVFTVSFSAMANSSDEKSTVNEKNEKAVVEATYSLQGTVYDPICNETISGATITINGKKYYSDLSGSFNIPALSKGKHTVSIDFVSYQQKNIEIDLDKNENLEVQLKQQ